MFALTRVQHSQRGWGGKLPPFVQNVKAQFTEGEWQEQGAGGRGGQSRGSLFTRVRGKSMSRFMSQLIRKLICHVCFVCDFIFNTLIENCRGKTK